MREEVATLDFPAAFEAIDQNIYELERGKPMPNLTHGSIQANLIIQLDRATRHQNFRIASEVALATSPLSSTPDVVIYPEQALNFFNEPAKQTEPPLLTIEIQSPSQSTDEMIEKVFRYFEFGVQSSWIVVPGLKGVFVYNRTGLYDFFHHDEVLVDSVMGIEIPLSKIFN